MGRKHLAAVFYGPHELAVAGSWGPFAQVDAEVTRLDDHMCTTIRFSQSDFFGLRTGTPSDSLADDPALPFARFFRDTATNAGCEVAFLVTRLHQADPDWLAGRYWMVQARDVNSLAAEAFGLLHLDDGMVLDWDKPRLDERSILPGGPGLTFFAGAGWARWF